MGRAEDDPIKVGILHSQTGPMAISEAVLADTMRMLIEQQNAKGGLLGPQAGGGNQPTRRRSPTCSRRLLKRC